MYRRYYRLALIASSSVFVSGVAQAQPPATNALPTAQPSTAELTRLLQADPGALRAFMPEGRDKFGSNMYALGKDAVSPGQQSMVFGNPHFPWSGTERLYISHLTIPGKLDIMGSSLYGVPAVLIGFNDHVAWSHTVSTAYRFNIYELTLNPLNPTQYVYDGSIARHGGGAAFDRGQGRVADHAHALSHALRPDHGLGGERCKRAAVDAREGLHAARRQRRERPADQPVRRLEPGQIPGRIHRPAQIHSWHSVGQHRGQRA